jgi:acylglycerol lipase
MTLKTRCTRHDWSAPDGETFSYSLWGFDPLADERPVAVVVAVHGLSGAALDYEPLGSRLAQHRIVTFAIELRGQGNDPRLPWRGDLEQIDDWFKDLSGFFLLVRSRCPDAPIYYYGESMGAALLTRFLAQALELEQPAGLILASPVVALLNRPPWWQEQLFRLFLWLRPTHRIDVRKLTRPKKNEPPKLVTRDEAHRRWFETASHKLDLFTVRFFKCLRDLINGCFAAAPKIRPPTLVIYAAHDIFIRPEQVEQFFARLGSREKELRLFPDSYHLLLHDHDKEQALECVESWLLRHIETAGLPAPIEARFTSRIEKISI